MAKTIAENAAESGEIASRKAGESVRFRAEDKRSEVWEPVDKAERELFSALAEIVHGVESLAGILREVEEEEIPYQLEYIRELDASASWIREITEDITCILQAASPDYV